MKYLAILMVFVFSFSLRAQTVIYSCLTDSLNFQISQFYDTVVFEYSNRNDTLVEKLTKSEYIFRDEYQIITVDLMNIRRVKVNSPRIFFMTQFEPNPFEFYINPFGFLAKHRMFYDIGYDTMDFFYVFNDKVKSTTERVYFSKEREYQYEKKALFKNEYEFKIGLTRKVDVIYSKIWLFDPPSENNPMVDKNRNLYVIFKHKNKWFVQFVDIDYKLKRKKIKYKVIELKFQ